MSHDPWGGGSDLDPKLRLKELGQYKAPQEASQVRRPYERRKPRISVLDALMIVLTACGVLIFLAVRG